MAVVLGLRSLSLQLNRIGDKLSREALEQELDKNARLMTSDMKAHASVDTGALRASLSVQRLNPRRRGDATVGVVSSEPPGKVLSLEYGNSRMTARPFIRPVFEKWEGTLLMAAMSAFVKRKARP